MMGTKTSRARKREVRREKKKAKASLEREKKEWQINPQKIPAQV